MTKIDGAVILVVGASGGLGSRVSERLAAQGALVVRAGRNPAHLSGPGAYLADLRTEAGAASLISAAIAEHGKLDGIVIAAGVVAFGPASELEDATLTELFEVNALGPIRLITRGFPALAESATGGREPFVLTISGVVSEAPTAGLAAYSSAKAALSAFVGAVSREYRRSGIRVLDARPGHTDTGLATRAIAGTAPAFGAALDPDAVADRLVKAIADGERDLPPSAF